MLCYSTALVEICNRAHVLVRLVLEHPISKKKKKKENIFEKIQSGSGGFGGDCDTSSTGEELNNLQLAAWKPHASLSFPFPLTDWSKTNLQAVLQAE